MYRIDFYTKVYYTGHIGKEFPMSENRKEKRKKIMAFTPVYDLNTHALLGYIGDLTMLGAHIVGEKPLEVDTNTTFAIDFPETSEFPARRVKVPARVVWNKQKDDKYYDSGIEFHNMSEKSREILESTLDRYQYRRL
jgi:hypothetical protein